MAASSENRGGRMARLGLRSMAPKWVGTVLDRVLGGKWGHVLAVDLDRDAWAEAHPHARALVEDHDKTSTPETSSLTTQLQTLSRSEAEQRVEMVVSDVASAVLRIPEANLDRVRPLRSLGLDSLMSLEFRNRLSTQLGRPVSATAIWNHPSVSALALALAEDICGPERAEEQVAPAPEQESMSHIAEVTHMTEGEAEEALLNELESLDLLK